MKSYLLQFVNFLFRLDESKKDAELHRKLVMVNSISLFAITVLCIMAIISYLRGNVILAVLDVSAAVVITGCLGYLRHTGKYEMPTYIGMSVMTALFIYLFFTGGANRTGFLWYFTYPTFALYLLGKKEGAIANFVLFTPAFIYLMILWPKESPLYSQDFTVRFIPAVFCVFLFSYLFETTKDKAHRKLQAKHRELEDTISALSEKEAELQKARDELERRVEKRTQELRASNDILKIEIEERKRSEESRKSLEVQLIRAKKMEAVGLLAGGVAHDLNNILSGIVSYPELLLCQLPADSAMRKQLAIIHQSGQKAAAIVQDLLAMARRGVSVEEVLNLNDVVNSYLESPECNMLKTSHPQATIRNVLDPTLALIKGSTIHLNKVIMNLVTNAAEALTDSGEIIIATENCILDKPVTGYEKIPPGDYVSLSVSDTGSGISPVDLQHIFEPFYTKKIMGRSGTGLGMSLVWGTVKDHNGYIDITSSMGAGTRVAIYFAATNEEPARSTADVSLENFRGNGELILVVDDQREQRQIARDSIHALGYKVDTVPSGEAAVTYLEQKRPDLIILDMIMDPGMDGLDTYNLIRKIDSTQRVVIASGFAENDRVRDAMRLGVIDLIRKPYSMNDLALLLYQALQ